MTELSLDVARGEISPGELAALGGDLRRGLADLDGRADAGFLRVLGRRALIKEIRDFARARRGTFRDVVQLGIGGSSLGGRALCQALLPALHNERVGRAGPRFHFPDNVDPEGFAALLETLDPRHTLVHVVSKSGGTLETLAQLWALRREWERRAPRLRARDRWVITTGEKGPLRDLAERDDIPVLTAPADVPGRYSVFTASGLLVPALCGVPVERVLRGARRMEVECRDDALLGPAGRLAALHHLHETARGRPIHVQLIYADALQSAGEWFRQIWAESLGKRGAGPTPVTARGTTDQHSQIQLYVEGPDDKVYTFVRVARLRANLKLPRAALPEEIAGRDLKAVFDAEAQGTLEALVGAGRPVIEIGLPRIAPEVLGELLLMQQLQTALAGTLRGVDPFTQPGVEAGKIAAMRILAARN